jgi:AraC-like DNA-binding protein
MHDFKQEACLPSEITDVVRLRTALAEKVRRFVGTPGERETPIDGLSFAMLFKPTAPIAYLYPPSLSLIVSGTKKVRLGSDEYVYDSSRFLITSVNLPTVTEVLSASEHSPYVALRMRLDVPLILNFMTNACLSVNQVVRSQPLAMGTTSASLLDAVKRLLDIMDDPQALRHLGPLIQQEIAYYILISSAGGRLREIMIPNTGSYRAAKAIAWIQENFAAALRIEELASHVGLGVSTLHKHFREMTAMSPLHYQKQLRLLEARRLLTVEMMEATMVAVQVGYLSPSQFNREYKRMFGDPPIRSMTAIRARLLGESGSPR